MKKLLITSLFTVLTFCVFAQEGLMTHKKRISINFGSMSPLGDLASNEKGFAEVGFGFSLDYAFLVSKNMAVTLGFTSGLMEMNEDRFDGEVGATS